MIRNARPLLGLVALLTIAIAGPALGAVAECVGPIGAPPIAVDAICPPQPTLPQPTDDTGAARVAITNWPTEANITITNLPEEIRVTGTVHVVEATSEPPSWDVVSENRVQRTIPTFDTFLTAVELRNHLGIPLDEGTFDACHIRVLTPTGFYNLKRWLVYGEERYHDRGLLGSTGRNTNHFLLEPWMLAGQDTELADRIDFSVSVNVDPIVVEYRSRCMAAASPP